MSSYLSKQELASLVKSDKPHVVILGAGASRAVCPEGDKNRKKLPLMSDLVKCVGLEPKLREWEINPEQNFEDIFSDLFDSGKFEKTIELEEIISIYFNKLELPNSPTIYDHLILSLRDKDCVASFNWDPLLLQAYRRNSNRGINLPRLVFLHGNVMQGYCEADGRINYLRRTCEICKKPLTPTKLLYPIKKKNYLKSKITKTNWKRLSSHLDHAFMLTIFGYSGPKTDEEAINMINEHWTAERFLDDTNFITNQSEDNTYLHWKDFIGEKHFQIYNNFYESELSKYPRRTLENSWVNNAEAMFTEMNPIPQEFNFTDLWNWCRQFTEAEEKFRRENPFPPAPQWYRKEVHRRV